MTYEEVVLDMRKVNRPRRVSLVSAMIASGIAET